MTRLLLQWILSAVALLLVSELVPGFYLEGFGSALAAALIIGLLNVTLGFLLKVVTFPLSILTLGLFLFVVNALMIRLASSLVRGFHVRGFLPAFIGAIVLAVLDLVFRQIVRAD